MENLKSGYLASWLMIFLSLMYSISILAQHNEQHSSIRIMSYNIHYGIGMDDIYSLENIANVIKKADPDLVGLQEIKDSLMTEELGKLTGMKAVFGPSLGTSKGYGDAILSKYPFESAGNLSIPSASPSRYQAMAVDVDFTHKSTSLGKIRLINTHFDWLSTIGSEQARLATVDVIVQAFCNTTVLPTVLTGDFNSKPDSELLKKFEKYGWINYQKGGPYKTHNSTRPQYQIDYILFKSNHRWKVKNNFVMYGEESSDHLPIVMDIIIRE